MALFGLAVYGGYEGRAWAKEWAKLTEEYIASGEYVARKYDCEIMRPVDQQYGLYFGATWVRSEDMNSMLNELFPDYVTYHHYGVGNFYNFERELDSNELAEVTSQRSGSLCAEFLSPHTKDVDDDAYEVLSKGADHMLVRVKLPQAATD